MRMKWQRFAVYVVGLMVLSFGITLTIKADIGVGAWDALHVGLSRLTGISIGKWVMITGLIIIFLNAYLLRQRPNFLSFITIFFIGLMIDGWMLVTGNLHLSDFIWKLGVFGTGLLLIALGLSIYLQSTWAPNPIDQLMFSISHRTGFNLTISKTIGEVSALLLAWLVNGPIGLGTFLITFLIGPLIQFFYGLIEPIYKRLDANFTITDQQK